MSFVLLVLFGMGIGFLGGRLFLDDPTLRAVDPLSTHDAPPAPAPSPPGTEPAAPPPPPDATQIEEPEVEQPEMPLTPVRLALTSYTHRTGIAEGSVLRACGVTDLPEGARLGYEIVPVSTGDTGWARARQPPHVYEGVVTLAADEDDRGLRSFCFQADVYASCGMEPFHPLNCPLHVSVWFASSVAGLSFTETQPDHVLEQFGVLGDRIGASEDCDLAAGCARVRRTDPPRLEYAERIFDACPPYRAGCLPRG